MTKSLTAEEFKSIQKMSADLLNTIDDKKTVSGIMKDKFFKDGFEIPECVNPNCHNKVACRDWKYWSFKSECSFCMTARKEKNYIFEDGVRWILVKGGKNTGIIMHKEPFCENHDGHLGFECPVPIDKWEGFESGLDLDHIDGNHYNNSPENVRTYCKLCHNRKSIDAGDCNSRKSSGRKVG